MNIPIFWTFRILKKLTKPYQVPCELVFWLRCPFLTYKCCAEPRVVVLIPSNPKMHHSLKTLMIKNVHQMIEANPTLSLRVFIDSGPLEALPGRQCSCAAMSHYATLAIALHTRHYGTPTEARAAQPAHAQIPCFRTPQN